MKTRIMCLFALVAIAATAGARTNVYDLNVGDFSKLRVLDGLNVEYRANPDSAGYVRFSATPDMADAVICENKGGTLKLQVLDALENMPGIPTVYVYSNFLSEVKNDGEGCVNVEGLSPTASFSATQIGNGSITVSGLKCTKVSASLTTGSGTITLSGSSSEVDIKLLGTGKIDTGNLKADKVRLSSAGTGSVSCWAVHDLNARCVGSTKIFYRPVPGLDIKKTGGGKLIELPDAEGNTGAGIRPAAQESPKVEVEEVEVEQVSGEEAQPEEEETPEVPVRKEREQTEEQQAPVLIY